MNTATGYTLTAPISKMTGNMQFVGMFCIIYGGLVSLTIIGALIGVPLILCGLRLRESADAFKAYAATAEAGQLNLALEKQNAFFYIQKILIIAGLVLTLLYIVAAIMFASYFAAMMGGAAFEG